VRHRSVSECANRGQVVILCGGLASSEYVWDKFHDYCQDLFDGEVKVIRPDNAWGAVSYGAAAYGMKRTLMVGRVARRHYGIEAHRQFRDGVDPEARSYMCPKFGKRLRGKIEWIVPMVCFLIPHF